MSSYQVREHGRILPVVLHDRQSEARTPAEPLYLIPETARDAYSPQAPLPFLRRLEEDLTRLAPGRPQADGQPVVITGAVFDEELRPVRDSLIEVWNANTYGRYSHADDVGRNDAPLDANFYGFGRIVTDSQGRYRVRTIKPGAYVARADIGWLRPPHLHFSILGGGVRLITQMYFPNDPLNEKDYIYLIIPEDERQRVIGQPIDPSGKDATFRFDIVVRGRYQTPLDT
jgi:protocatechuate 3,4-dioxygenase, beta subunit